MPKLYWNKCQCPCRLDTGVVLDHVVVIFLQSPHCYTFTTTSVSAEYHIMEGVGWVTCDDCESRVHGNQSGHVYTT